MKMDPEWYEKVKNKTTWEQWELLFQQQKEKRIDHKSVWLPRGDIYKHASLLVEFLPRIFKDLNIKSFIDVGCSDCLWQSTMDWSEIDYTGVEIVRALVKENRLRYPKLKFEWKNLIDDQCQAADMIFIRNVLLHTKLNDISKIIENVKRSGSRYLMASTLPYIKENMETRCIWAVRRNLQIEPFNLPEPLYLIPEIKSEFLRSPDNNYMGVWEVDKL